MNGKRGKSPNKIDFRVILQIRDDVIEVDVDDKLHIPSIDILSPQKACNMMAENPALHARWNVMANQAAVDFDREKISFEIWEKETSKHYRMELTEVSGKRVTDKMVEESVMTDPEYKRRYFEMLKKKEDAANIRSIAFGFGERGERLVNIVSMMKNEKSTSALKDEEPDDIRAFSNKNDDEETT
jgi:hypothetical protein